MDHMISRMMAAAGLCAWAGCGILTDDTQKLVATVHAIADHHWLAALAASTVASWSVTVHLCSTGVASCKPDAPLDSPEVLRPHRAWNALQASFGNKKLKI
jgi:hypothetical protein